MTKKTTDTPTGFDLSALNAPQLERLSQLMADNGLTELEFEQHGTRIKLGRGVTMAAASQPFTLATPAAATPAPVAAPAAPVNEIKAPLVGTFYHASAPDAAPFVKVGDTVRVGQVIGIIEAMKTMNPVEADKAGTVTAIIAPNARAVEYGQPLIALA
ncbi:MAG: acetyl-CoA carboxylase biotin carboxyl carrier protein [Alphaproteobacteria bacterium]